MSNYFSMQIKAPNGLEGVEPLLSKCKLSLEVWPSGYNGKIVLRAKPNSDFEWSMDSSDTDVVGGAGEIFNGIDFTVEALRSLSNILKELELPHTILIDDEHSYLYEEITYLWDDENTL